MVSIVCVDLQLCRFVDYVCIKAGHLRRMKAMHIKMFTALE